MVTRDLKEKLLINKSEVRLSLEINLECKAIPE